MFGTLAPRVSALIVELASFLLFLLFAAQFQSQLVGYIARDLLLDQQEIGNFAAIALAPVIRVVASVDQRDVDRQGIAAFADIAGQDRMHVEVLPNLSDIIF